MAPTWRTLHAWVGIAPLAGYLVVHLLLQARALRGPRAFAASAGLVPAPWGFVLELVLVYVPLLLHVGLGLLRLGSEALPEASPAERVVQRASALGLLAFLCVHLWQFRVRLWSGVISTADYYPELCSSLSSTVWGGVPLVAIGYLAGIGAAAAHTALGLYRAGLGLGLVGAPRERIWRHGCSALGAGLFGLGALIVIDLATGSVLIHLRGF